jgi:acylaminoacyl-peptidase
MLQGASIPLIPRRALFGNADALDPRLSPDGRWLAWLAAADGVMNVWAAPRDDPSKARALTRQTDRPIFMHWFARTNEHVLFSKDRDGDENYNLWRVGVDGSEPVNLTPGREMLAILVGMHRENPDLVAVAMNDRDARWHDLYIVDIRSGERRLVYENRDEIASFILGDRLDLRLATTTRGKDGGSAILEWNGAAFREIVSIDVGDALETEPLHLNRGGDAWFLRSSIGRDKAVIQRVDCASGARTTIASDEKADIGGWIADPRTDEVTAVFADYIGRKWFAIDPAVGRDLSRLERELDATIAVVSQSDDDSLWVVGLERPDRPYSWRLLDRRTGDISMLFSSRPKLDDAKLSPMQGVVITARDGLELVSYLTLPPNETRARPEHPLPMTLCVHGGPWGRDRWRFSRDAQWLANRGYAVLQVNFRGSTGFGKAFVNAGDREWGGKMQDDLIDAVNWAVAERIADPARIAIYGASYGGYAAFVGAAFTPDVFCCSVPVVGVTNLETMLANPPPYWTSFAEQEYHRIGDPRTPEGRALLAARSPLGRAGEITAPMLIAHGAHDVRCKISESDQIVAAMADNRIPVIYVVFPDEGHGFERPENDLAFRAIMEAFLASRLGGRAEPVGDDFAGSSHEIRAGAEILRKVLSEADGAGHRSSQSRA